MNDKKKYISANSLFELEHPVKWVVEEDKDCVSFFEPIDGVGAFQISSYQAPPEDLVDLKKMAQEHIQCEGVNADIIEYRRNSMRIATTRFIKDKRYWKIWFIATCNYFLFVTYTCSEEDKEIKEKQVEDMISSIKLRK